MAHGMSHSMDSDYLTQVAAVVEGFLQLVSKRNAWPSV